MLPAQMDGFGRPAWALAGLLGFWLFRPLGLAALAHLAWSGRLPALAGAPGRWSEPRGGFAAWSWPGKAAPSGDLAFGGYRDETPRRLEEERHEFEGYLDHLRRARDKAEFDRFMAERRERSEAGTAVDKTPATDATGTDPKRES